MGAVVAEGGAWAGGSWAGAIWAVEPSAGAVAGAVVPSWGKADSVPAPAAASGEDGTAVSVGRPGAASVGISARGRLGVNRGRREAGDVRRAGIGRRRCAGDWAATSVSTLVSRIGSPGVSSVCRGRC